LALTTLSPICVLWQIYVFLQCGSQLIGKKHAIRYMEFGIRNRGRPRKPVGVAGLLNPGEDRWLTYSRASGDMVAISLPLSLCRPVPLTCTLYRLLSRSGTRQSGKLTSFDCICKASLSYRNYRILPMCGLPMCIYIFPICVSLPLSLSWFLCQWTWAFANCIAITA